METLKNKLKNIIDTCADKKIPTTIHKDGNGKEYYEIYGFSKSGIAKVFILNNKIICETRYSTLDEIDSFDDLSLVAFEWYVKYKNRSPFEQPDSFWAEHWYQNGWIKKDIKIIYSL